MLERIVEQEVIFYAMGILTVFGALAKLVSYFTVRRMVGAAREIQKSNHKLMRLIKAKFEHASMVSDKVQNVGAFVEKYIYEYKVFGVRLNSWRNFPKKATWLVGILGAFSIFESYRIAGISDLFTEAIQWTGMFVMLLLLLIFVAEENSRLSAAKNYMVEYLENVCIHRYAKMHQAARSEEAVVEEVSEEVEEETSEDVVEQCEEIQEKNEQEMRIRAILEEFLA